MLRPTAIALEALSLRRYADDSEIGRVPMTDVEKAHGAPIWVTHRTDLQRVLETGAKTAGAQIYTNCVINDIDFANTSIKILNSPDWIQADVIIGADGIKSMTRKKMLAAHGDVDKIRETGDAAWRVVLSAEQIYATKDPELIEALESSIGFRWMGPDGHIMCYPIRNHKLLNLVLLHPDQPGTEESWTKKGDKKEMVEFYKTWNARVKKIVDCVSADKLLEWKMCDHSPLATWVENQVALIGDAAHSMLPYVSQGAAQAVEDGAVLGACLSMINNKDQINTALKVYELVRKERAETVQASAAQTRRVLHFHDGKEQEERDELIRNAAKGGPNPDLWSDRSFQKWCWVSFLQYFL
jgi:salicylate hydroxylase